MRSYREPLCNREPLSRGPSMGIALAVILACASFGQLLWFK